MRNNRYTLPAIIILALVVRVISLADHSLWYDEAFSVLFAQNDISTMVTGTVNAIEHPLLYYLSLNVWMRVAGDSVFMIRLFSVLIGVATIAVMYLLGRDWFDRRTGLVIALLTAIAPFHLQYSQEARMYSLLALLLMLTTWFYVRGAHALTQSHVDADTAERKTTRAVPQGVWWGLFGISAGLAMHTQQLAAFYLLALGLAPLLARRWDVFLRVVGGAGIALVIFAPWLINLPAQLAQLNVNYWINKPTAFDPFITLGIFFVGFHEYAVSQALWLYGGAIFITLLALAQVGLYARKPRRRQSSDTGAITLVLWLFIAPIVLMWLVSQVAPIYLERALIPAAMMLYVMLGWFFTRAGVPRRMSYGLIVIVGALFARGDWQQYQVDSFPYAPVDTAMTYIASNSTDPIIIHMNKLTMLPAQVATPQLTHRFIADREGSPQDTLDPSTQDVLGVRESRCVQAAAHGASDTVWLVTLARAEQQYRSSDSDDFNDTRAWLRETFVPSGEQTFKDLNIYRYTVTDTTFARDCD